uniref:Uncharacterized protein n=1 Tax=Photinus pyralis TaxID=7054 RepID=A0A1Y1LKR3_PHOPY
MRCPSLNFITLHYAYIFVMGLLSIPFLYLYGNISAIDAYFMGSSASTESGLNVANLNELKLYQQLYLYFTTVFTQMGFVNILVVVVRLYWFNKHLSSFDAMFSKALLSSMPVEEEAQTLRRTLAWNTENSRYLHQTHLGQQKPEPLAK